MKTPPPKDILAHRHGSITLLVANTPAGRAFIHDKLDFEAWQLIGGGIAAEPRYAEAVLSGARADGLSV